MNDSEEVESKKVQSLSIISQTINKRQQIEGHLTIAVAANGQCIGKLHSMAEMKHLSTSKTGTVSAKKNTQEGT